MTDSRDLEPSRAWLALLGGLAAACIIAGTLARFWGLGRWPLAIDEYYFAQSVQNLLHFGIPRFPCGGLYVRGLVLQYASAALQWMGLSAELAPRLLAAVSSLILLPAIYQIGRRLGGRQLALLAIAILGLSVWEIEMGRFGRMYAPFQALFAWYVVFFLRYVIDGNRRALAPMLVLSALGFATWEGGLFLVLTNLLPPFIAHPDGRLTRRDWLYLGGCSLLLIPAYVLTMADLRTSGGEPTLPPDYVEPPDTPSLSRLDAALSPWTTLPAHIGWAIAALLPAALIFYAAMREVLTRRRGPLPALAILAILGCAALQQFQLALGLIILCVLLGILDGRELVSRESRPMQIALLACVLFWTAFGLSTNGWLTPGLSPLHKAMLLGYEFVRLPDTVREVAMPWARTVPLLALGLFLLVGACCLRACVYFKDTSLQERVLLTLFVILLLAAAASHPPRHETRYVFFLYPFAILFSLLTLQRLANALLGPTPVAAAAGALACIAAFLCSEDFRPVHLWNIDSAAINFRIGMSGRLAGHYHPRSDVRGAADWLRAHATPGTDIVIDSFPGVDFYYRQSDFYFVADADPRFEVWSCSRGTRQRWSNLPMIHSYDTLLAQIASGRRVWMVLETGGMDPILAKIPPGTWTVAWTSLKHDITIVSVREPARQSSSR
ncbi:MAG: glycosyltransferase family 39 protein [Sinobacteraceae bacterium]|nr:glycosyltransferase family 39 protein [Nevskiaceae bacterium]